MKRRSEDTKKSKAVWTDDDDEALLKAVSEDQKNRATDGDAEDEEDWDEIAKSVPGKTPVQCLKRYMALNSKKQAAEPKAASPASAATSEEANPAAEPDDAKPSPVQAEVKTEEPSEAQEKDDDMGEKPSKAPRIESADGSAEWPEDESDLLKKLVEQYKDSKYYLHERSKCDASTPFVSHLLYFYSCLQVRHDGMRLPQTLQIETPSIV